MCGIFGLVGDSCLDERSIKTLVHHAEQRGRDSSGLVVEHGGSLKCFRSDFSIHDLVKKTPIATSSFFFGHSRQITNGHANNQPVIRGDVYVIHDGIIVNHDELWERLGAERHLEIDTEIIAAIAETHLAEGGEVETIGARVLELCRGVVACALALPRLGKLLLFSNNGSPYLGERDGSTLFASEEYPLKLVGCTNVRQVRDAVVLDIPATSGPIPLTERLDRKHNLVPALLLSGAEEHLLVHPQHQLRRCTRCILPSTMPYIRFDDEGICNYCHAYRPRNNPRPQDEIFELVAPYRRDGNVDCIVPFSGGRDSCYALHLIVNELKMNPITYTYDWGMVTDLGRRNISRMSAELGVENIIVAADIKQKRDNIRRNLQAWLKSPHLGMISILTAGDKHFFKHVETMKRQTGVGLNLWGINPLEVTHFKAGFLGIPPDFEEERVYSHGAMKQLRYQSLRFRAMTKSPSYFNRSLWDTLSGEYYRSFTEKSDYYHVFDYWRWDEEQIDSTLDTYDWERAPDTSTTWRIGDGTAAFYNYVYYTVAGFTEHDTFRSNQIREGEMSRERALELVSAENRPRYPNIKWYLDVLGLDFASVISTVNSIDRMYEE